MQPVLLNPNPNNGRFTMIAGERRLRAIQINGQAAIPALLTKATADEAMLMQLAENVQREELSLEDECKAIVKLYEILGSLKEVAAKVKKSVPWCSKRFAMNQTNLHWRARHLLEEGHTEDIDLIKAASNLFEIVEYNNILEWTEKIIKGEAGRNEIRAALKAKKEEIKQEKVKEKAEEKVSHAKVKTPPPPPVWTLDQAIEDLEEALTYANAKKSAKDLFFSWTEDQQKEVSAKLEDWAKQGSYSGGFSHIGKIVFGGFHQSKVHDIGLLAMINGYGGQPFDLMGFFANLQTPREKA